ncbi:MAG TPA: radical SAM protein, partial [Cytophagaceae bacterium]|nr:radical SAM protein [Cytophagaceae bacterium]
FQNGYREITLLGQNVDSYKWESEDQSEKVNFAQLMEMVALVNPDLRIRFSTSHPKDITDEVLHTMAKYENICKYIHLPAQSGNNRILDRMARNYTREFYLEKIKAIKTIVGEDCGIATDIITGFCGETEEEHQDTIALMEEVVYDYAYMFAYSERPGTPAAKKYTDDVPDDVKNRRLTEIITLHRETALIKNKRSVGKTMKVLIDGFSKKSDDYLRGRCSNNAVVLFPRKHYEKGQYVMVHVTDCNTATLFGEVVG